MPSPVLIAARGYFQLRDYHACIEALEGVNVTRDTEGSRLLGLSLGYVSDPRATAALQRAVELSPSDPNLGAALLSAQLRSGTAPCRLEAAPKGALGELTAAGWWLRGRAELQRLNAAEAATAFRRAGLLFASESPLENRNVRVGASYVGAAISYLLAGDSDAAQNAFATMAGEVSRELRLFANTLHAVGEEFRGSEEAERREALAPLAELVTSTQLHVGFYGRPGPVDLQWSGSDLAALTGYRRQGG